MKNKTTIMFDLDGTLTDPAIGITRSVDHALEFFGIRTKDLRELCKFIGPPLKDSFMKYYGFDETTAMVAVDKYREYFRETGIYENELIEGIDILLAKLSESGRQLILATSKPKVFADIILEHFGLMKYFSIVCGSELDGTRVNKDEVIAYALEKAGIADLRSTVMIGDREHDVIGAQKAGIDCIGVLFGYGSREELQEAGAALLVETVEELEAALI
ncbi:MAG: HAD family hydrolase [Clostridiaceae bacterium]|jgi:phosphoglycolate phosphatase|nr:HAD family hydrolase [Clostridiaceae bacterium]